MADPSAFVKDPQFMTAVERARMIANKLASQAPGASGGAPPGMGASGQKRSFDEDDSWNNKRPNMMNDVAAKIHDFRQASGTGSGALGAGVPGVIPKLGERPVLEGIILNGEKTLDMLIPGSKVGYIIGKGGEMIRNLQDRANVKMTIFQQTNDASENEKQLRIIGHPERVDHCRDLVNELLVEKDLEASKGGRPRMPGSNGSGGGHNEYGSALGGRNVGMGNSREVAVPPSFIGLVIGKGGENIKRIQQESMTKIQFDTSKSDSKGNKICTIFGPPDCIGRAEDMIQEIIDNAAANRRVTDRPGNNFHGGDEVRMTVPANRTGAVIGRGGDTIRAIKQESGCDIELDKMSKTMGGDDKVFIIRGPPDRIPIAQRLINDKVRSTGREREHREPTPPRDPNAYGSCSGDYSWSNYVAAEHGMYTAPIPNNPDAAQDQSAQWQAYYAQMYAGGGAGAAEPPANASANGSQAAGDQDYSTQWAAYYRAYGMEKEAQQIEQMARTKGQGSAFHDRKLDGDP